MAFVAPHNSVSYHSPFPPQSAPQQNSLKDYSTVTGAFRSQIPNQCFLTLGPMAPSDHMAGCRGFVGSMGHSSSASLASDSARWLIGLKAFPACPLSTLFHSWCAMSSSSIASGHAKRSPPKCESWMVSLLSLLSSEITIPGCPFGHPLMESRNSMQNCTLFLE